MAEVVSNSEEHQKKPLFRDLNADDEDPEVTEVESLCMNCHENGYTKFLLTKIPFFREIIIMSFECPHCGLKNNEIQSGGQIQEKGVRYTIHIKTPEMLNRQIVKESSASYVIKEIGFEAPAFKGKGTLSTLEGLLTEAITGLQQQQPVRRITQPEIAAKIDETVSELEKYKQGDSPFTLVLEDCAGNSFVENPSAPASDPCIITEWFIRTKEQNQSLGIQEEEEEENIKEETDEKNTDLKDEVLEFPCNCPECGSPTSQKMKIVEIPHFKEVIIMAMNCDACGHRSNEVKPGGGTEEKGRKITLKMTDKIDLSRDVLMSHSCNISIPSMGLELGHASMGGKFTTLEGIFTNMKDELSKVNPFAFGDSASSQNRMKELYEQFDQIITGKLFVTIELDDPLGNSYVQNIYAPDPDPELDIEIYERTEEQNEEFGISDIKTDNYT